MTTPRIRHSGTSGPGAVTLRIGGISVAVSSDDPGLTLRVPETARSFLVSGADADASVIAGWGDLAAPVQGDKIFDSGLLWQLYRQDAAYVFRFASPVFGAIPYKQASLTRTSPPAASCCIASTSGAAMRWTRSNTRSTSC